MKKRRNFSPEFKTQVVLELLCEEKELNQLASEHDIAPNVLRN
jgi:putative transposase